MTEAANIHAWIALFIGLYSLSAGVAELRSPGKWLAMATDLENSPATMFLSGIFCIALGGTLYLIGSNHAGDWLGMAVWIIGGLMVVEGCVFIVAGDRFIGLWKRLMSGNMSIWAGASALLGGILIFIGISRLPLA